MCNCYCRISIFEKWENAYLSNSLSRLLDPVNSMFSLENAPSHDQIDSLIRTITRYVFKISQINKVPK